MNKQIDIYFSRNINTPHMEFTKQQSESLHYFNNNAEKWAKKVKSDQKYRVNTALFRDSYVMDIISSRKSIKTALDVGCGSGELISAINGKNIESTGIDISPEMIRVAKITTKQRRASKITFICDSFFNHNFKQSSYDLITANGFIEYISSTQLSSFLKTSHHILNKRGSLVLSARNRLFNIISMNTFTEQEIKNKTLSILTRECMDFIQSDTLQQFESLKSSPLENNNEKQVNTGINVSVRYQYTPKQLIALFKKHGFKTLDIYPVHIHGVSPAFKKKRPEIHSMITNILQQYARDSREFLPFASMFIIHGEKR